MPSGSARPRRPTGPLADKLRSPRETLKTLYFAVILYDLFPQMIDDAVACLDLDAVQPRPAPEDAAMLALDLEYILQSLALPLSGVPDEAAGDAVVLHDADGFKLAMRRGPDGGWRFDAETLERLPAMRRAAAERRQQRGRGPGRPARGLHRPARDAAAVRLRRRPRRLLRGGPGPRPQLAEQRAAPPAGAGPGPATRLRPAAARVHVPPGSARPAGRPALHLARRQERPHRPRPRPAAGRQGRLAVHPADGAEHPADVRGGPGRPNPTPATCACGWSCPACRPTAAPPSRSGRRTCPPTSARRGRCSRASSAPWTPPTPTTPGWPTPWNTSTWTTSRSPTARPLGGKLAAKLEAVLRKLPIDLGAVPDDWNAPPQVLGEAQGVRVEILRQRDGCWCFSEATVARIPEMFDKLAGKARPEQGRGVAPGQRPRHGDDLPGRRPPPRLHAGRPLPEPERDPRPAPRTTRPGPGLQAQVRPRPDRPDLHPGDPRQAGGAALRPLPRRAGADRPGPQGGRPGQGAVAVHPRNRAAHRADVPRRARQAAGRRSEHGDGRAGGAALLGDAGRLAAAAAARLAADAAWARWTSTSGWGWSWRPWPAGPAPG